MNCTTRLKIGDINKNFLCVLCKGYLIDATTIIECLHSFCRTCIVTYLKTSKTCPVCDTLVHKTRPHQNIRSDKLLQDLVYKLVPGLYKDEMRRRREFYTIHYDAAPKRPGEERGDEMSDRFAYTEEESISLAMHFCPDGASQRVDFRRVLASQEDLKASVEKRIKTAVDVRYLQCKAAVTVGHLKKFIRLKYGLSPHLQVDVFYNDEPLRNSSTLCDVAYYYNWTRRAPLVLTFSVFEATKQERPQKIASLVTSQPTLVKQKPASHKKQCLNHVASSKLVSHKKQALKTEPSTPLVSHKKQFVDPELPDSSASHKKQCLNPEPPSQQVSHKKQCVESVALNQAVIHKKQCLNSEPSSQQANYKCVTTSQPVSQREQILDSELSSQQVSHNNQRLHLDTLCSLVGSDTSQQPGPSKANTSLNSKPSKSSKPQTLSKAAAKKHKIKTEPIKLSEPTHASSWEAQYCSFNNTSSSSDKVSSKSDLKLPRDSQPSTLTSKQLTAPSVLGKRSAASCEPSQRPTKVAALDPLACASTMTSSCGGWTITSGPQRLPPVPLPVNVSESSILRMARTEVSSKPSATLNFSVSSILNAATTRPCSTSVSASINTTLLSTPKIRTLASAGTSATPPAPISHPGSARTVLVLPSSTPARPATSQPSSKIKAPNRHLVPDPKKSSSRRSSTEASLVPPTSAAGDTPAASTNSVASPTPASSASPTPAAVPSQQSQTQGSDSHPPVSVTSQQAPVGSHISVKDKNTMDVSLPVQPPVTSTCRTGVPQKDNTDATSIKVSVRTYNPAPQQPSTNSPCTGPVHHSPAQPSLTKSVMCSQSAAPSPSPGSLLTTPAKTDERASSATYSSDRPGSSTARASLQKQTKQKKIADIANTLHKRVSDAMLSKRTSSPNGRSACPSSSSILKSFSMTHKEFESSPLNSLSFQGLTSKPCLQPHQVNAHLLMSAGSPAAQNSQSDEPLNLVKRDKELVRLTNGLYLLDIPASVSSLH